MAKAPKEAVLISPSGGEYVPGSAEEANNLIYGYGYKPKADKVSAAEATAAAGDVTADEAGPKTAPKTSK